jgi:hypothetical protein
VGVGGVAGNTDVDMVGEGVMDDDGTSTVSGALKGVSASRGSVCREDGGSTMVDDSVEVSRFEGGGYSSANLTIFLQPGLVEAEVVLDTVELASTSSSS